MTMELIAILVIAVFLLEIVCKLIFKRSIIKEIFPKFSEVSLFMLSLVLIYTLIFSGDAMEMLQNLTYSFYDPFIMSYSLEVYWLIFGLLFLGFGALLSIYYALSNKLPSRAAGALLIIYGAVSFAIIGLVAAQQLYIQAPSVEMLPFGEFFFIFPIYTFFQAIFMVSIVISDLEHHIVEPWFSVSEVNARRTEILSAFIIVSALFFALELFSTLPWFLIASICLTLCNLFIKLTERIFFSHVRSLKSK